MRCSYIYSVVRSTPEVSNIFGAINHVISWQTPISITSARSGSVRIGTLLPTLALSIALSAIVPIICYGLPLSASGTAMTLPAHSGFVTVVDISSMPLVYSYRPPRLCVNPNHPSQPQGLSAYVYNILLSACVLVDAPMWFSSTRNINCSSKKEDLFTLMEISVRNYPSLDTSPPRSTCIISSSLMITLMEAWES